jgi:hypothetical protein
MSNRTEANVLNDCLVALSGAGCTAWRNNTGQLPDKNGRPIKFGLCVGSSDIIGIAPDGIFIAIECKTAIGQPTDAQVRFINAVIAKGGRAGIARNSADAVQIALAKVSGTG